MSEKQRKLSTMLHETDDFSKLVENMMEEFKIPGLAMAIVDGDTIHTKNYGQAQIQGNACAADTLFDCASTAKSFTAAAVALLVQDERYPDVSWTTPVSKILGEDFVLSDPMYTENVTVEDILSHRSGLPSHDDSYLGADAKEKQDSAKSVTRNLRNLPILKPLRTDYQYCNMMFTVATHIVESVTGESFPEFVKTRLWEPLGMSNTFFDVPDVEAAGAMGRMATGYRYYEETGVHVGIPSYAQPEAQGAGCVFSSAGDWAKWVRAMLRHSEPLSKSSYEELVKPRTIIHDEEGESIPLCGIPTYALGWLVESYRGHPLRGHDGSFSGFKAIMRFMPDQDWGIVIFGNAETADTAQQIMFHMLMDDKLNVPQDDRLDWTKHWKTSQEKYESEYQETLKQLSELSTESRGIPFEKLVGSYHNSGYHTLNLELCDGKLESDCFDRCMPFKLTFYPSEGHEFVVKMHWTRDGGIKKTKAEAKVDEQGQVTSLGIAFLDEMEDYLIWFDKVV